MGIKVLKDRRPHAVTAFSVLVLAAAASWVANAGVVPAGGTQAAERARASEDTSLPSVIVHDNESASSLQTKLFLHRQGFFAQPIGSADQ